MEVMIIPPVEIYEKQIQEWIIKLIEEDKLLESIVNVDQIDRALRQRYDEQFIPQFSIDYVIRRNYLQMAKRVIESLYELDFISGKTIRNISLDKSEILRPDLVLFNIEDPVVILVEIKRSNQSEREAITELLGYSQEIRNHLPFLSNFELLHVLISTEYSTLLQHSLSSLIFHRSINLLCLEPIIKDDELLALEVFFPDAWTDTIQAYLPREALVTRTISLYGIDSIENEAKIYRLLETAADLIVSEGNHSNSHGFLLVCKDLLEGLSVARYFITICSVDPYKIFSDIVHSYRDAALTLNTQNPLAEYLLDFIDEWGEIQITDSGFAIYKPAISFLKSHCEPTIEGLLQWIELINTFTWKEGCLPVFFDSWGFIGEFIRFFYTHPGVKKHYFPEYHRSGRNYKDPRVGIQVINYMTGSNLIKGGHFPPSSLYFFGKSLKGVFDICHTIRSIEGGKYKNLEASLFWRLVELLPMIKEIGFRYWNTTNIKPPPPFIAPSFPSGIDECFDSILTFRNWFSSDFIGMKNQFHLFIFDIGFHHGLYYDEYFRVSLKPDQIGFIENSLLDFCKDFLIEHITLYKKQEITLSEKSKFLLDKVYLTEKLTNVSTREETVQILNRLSPKTILDNFETDFMAIVDDLIPELFHTLEDHSQTGSMDWDWLKTQIKKRRSEGEKYPAIELKSDGTWKIIRLHSEERILRPLEDDKEVYFRQWVSGIPITTVVSWDDLISSKACIEVNKDVGNKKSNNIE